MTVSAEPARLPTQKPTPVPLHRGDWLWIAGLAIALRASICVIVCIHSRLSIDQYARLYDGNSYLITAVAMLGDRSQFNDFHGRVFPGFPALIAIVHRGGIPLAITAVGIDWFCAATAAVLAGVLFIDRRVGLAMACLFPHYLMNSALALSEAPLLAFTLAGLLLVHRQRAVRGGAAIGIAGLIRPMACFALVGSTVAQWVNSPETNPRSRSLRVLLVGAFAGMTFLAGLLLVQHWRGDALANARYYASSPNSYDGQLLSWPFHSLLTTPRLRHVPPGRVIYIWAHAVFALVGCGLLVRPFFTPGLFARGLFVRGLFARRMTLDYRDGLAAPWLWCNTLFALCTGSVWGFECFHRFLIPALPALFWALRKALPRKPIGWIAIAITSMVIAVITITHDHPPVQAFHSPFADVFKRS